MPGEFHLRGSFGMHHGSAVRLVLQSQLGGALVAARGGALLRHVGAGHQWDVFCRYVHPNPQPRTNAATAAAAYLNSGGTDHGWRNHGVLTGESSPVPQIKFLAVYCVVFTTVCFLLFETVLNAE